MSSCFSKSKPLFRTWRTIIPKAPQCASGLRSTWGRASKCACEERDKVNLHGAERPLQLPGIAPKKTRASTQPLASAERAYCQPRQF